MHLSVYGPCPPSPLNLSPSTGALKSFLRPSICGTIQLWVASRPCERMAWLLCHLIGQTLKKRHSLTSCAFDLGYNSPLEINGHLNMDASEASCRTTKAQDPTGDNCTLLAGLNILKRTFAFAIQTLCLKVLHNQIHENNPVDAWK